MKITTQQINEGSLNLLKKDSDHYNIFKPLAVKIGMNHCIIIQIINQFGHLTQTEILDTFPIISRAQFMYGIRDIKKLGLIKTKRFYRGGVSYTLNISAILEIINN